MSELPVEQTGRASQGPLYGYGYPNLGPAMAYKLGPTAKF